MLKELEIHLVPKSAEHRTGEGIPWPQIYGHYLDQCQTIHDTIKAMPHLTPDLVVAHGGRGAPTLVPARGARLPDHHLLRILFCHQSSRHLVPDRPAAGRARAVFPRCINAPTLATLVDCDAGYSATQWQKQSFPARFRHKIEVHFDGIDTELYRPGPSSRQIWRSIDPRRHEGGDLRIARPRVDPWLRPLHEGRQAHLQGASDVIFVVAGGEEIHYGWDKLHTGAPSFKEWVLRGQADDLDRFIFTGRVLARATGVDLPAERSAHLLDGAVRSVVVAAGCDGDRLRRAGLGRCARA